LDPMLCVLIVLRMLRPARRFATDRGILLRPDPGGGAGNVGGASWVW
jgi:hypothetical protein